MNAHKALNMILQLLIFLTDESQMKPVPDLEIRSRGSSKIQSPGHRVRRSIQEMDAVNPAYFDFESRQPDQEQPMDPQGDVSQFSLSDHVANLFRNHKPTKQVQRILARPALHGERAMNLAKEDESVDQGGLPADEQEDCYRQQNLEPPALHEVGPQRPQWVKVDASALGPPQSFVRKNANAGLVPEERQNIVKQRYFQDVNSLYTNPKEALKSKQKKYINNAEVHEPIEYKVYKPVGVEAEFPIYDQDLDFNPDPLQGILDDKYWLDPQEREAVVRKYIDLAADNMMPEGYEKRSADDKERNGKSFDSKAGFKNFDNQCPCRDISACGECSKGKAQKKNNCSDSNDVGVSYGRKLLSLVDDHERGVNSFDDEELVLQNQKQEITRGIFGENNVDSPLKYSDVSVEMLEEESQIDEDVPIYSNFGSRKLLSMEFEGNDDELEDLLPDESVIDYTKLKFGKRLLWYDSYDENEGSYNNDDGEKLDNIKVSKLVNHEKERNDYYNEKQKQQHFHPKRYAKSRDGYFINSTVSPYNHLMEHGFSHKGSQHVGYFEPNKLGNVIEKMFEEKPKSNVKNMTSSFLERDLEEKLSSQKDAAPKYYQANQIANALKKPFQEKPKGSSKNRTDITSEFIKLKNETLTNVTYEAASEKPPRPPICFKRSHEVTSKNYKGRRSNSDLAFLKDQQAESPDTHALQQANEAKNVTQNNVTSSIHMNITITPNPTFITHNKTNIISKPNEDELAVEESNLGSQIANNIVESVISDTQKSSIFGHNLGVCRKNESMIKVKYGKIVPEAEKVIKSVTDCIMEKIRAHLAKQSCILLDSELLEFLKWMVLSGESYKDYVQKLGPKYYDFIPSVPTVQTTCANPTSQTCEMEPLPPNPNVVSSLGSSESGNVFS